MRHSAGHIAFIIIIIFEILLKDYHSITLFPEGWGKSGLGK